MADETDYAMTLYVVSWVLGTLVIIVVTARLCGRAFVINQTGWDDFFMAFGALAAIVCSALVTVGVSHGLGRHREQITDLHDRSEAIKYTIIAPVLSIISSSCSKISILIFLVRLMGMTAKKWQLYFLWGLCVILVGLNIFAIVLIVRFCDPPARQWDPDIDGTCIDPQVQLYGGAVQAGYNALMDIIVAIFPSLFITRLNITRKMKLGLCFLMGGSILRRNGSSGSGYGPYKNASINPAHMQGSEAYKLSNSKPRQGPVTRALQEVDDLRTLQTRNDD
ncbi:hypothetical protein AAE478_009309 [Parahypoxylon ruwenzoriense]